MDVGTPLGTSLTQSDVDNLRHFVQDYTFRALIPYVERLIVILNESVTNKKVSKTLFGATKRWFGTNKPGAKNTQNSVVYVLIVISHCQFIFFQNLIYFLFRILKKYII